MACRQRRDLLGAAGDEWIGRDEERPGLPLDEGGEGGVDLAFAAGFQDMELHPVRARRVLHLSRHALARRIVRIDEHADHPGLGNQLPQQLEPLGIELNDEGADAREVGARPGQAGDQAVRDRIVTANEDDRDRRGCLFCSTCRGGAAGCRDQVDLAAD
jgi:hypothetical protein